MHWVMLRMRGIVNQVGEKVRVWIASFGSKDRTEAYVRKLPFVEWGGYVDMTAHRDLFVQVYVHGKELQNWRGFGMVIGANHAIETGEPFEKWHPEWPVDHHYPMVLSPEIVAKAHEYRRRFGRYVATVFYQHGYFISWPWAKEPEKVVHELLGSAYEVVLTGASWDRHVNVKSPHVHDLVGQTSYDDLVALQLGAVAWVGHAAGNGMVAHHLRVPTVLLWGKTFKPGMARNWTRLGDESYAVVDDRSTLRDVSAAVERVAAAADARAGVLAAQGLRLLGANEEVPVRRELLPQAESTRGDAGGAAVDSPTSAAVEPPSFDRPVGS